MDFRILLPIDVACFDGMCGIYRDAIAVSEQKAPDQLRTMLARSDYRFIVAWHEGRIAGFSIVFVPAHADFGLLEYLAVDRPFRGKGIGQELFLRSVSELSQNGTGRAMLVEVESDVPEGIDLALRRARQEFYRRLGCRRITGLSYLLPIPSSPPPPPMHLLVFRDPPVQATPHATLQRWLSTIYTSVYGCSLDDPRIRRMFQGLPDPTQLG